MDTRRRSPARNTRGRPPSNTAKSPIDEKKLKKTTSRKSPARKTSTEKEAKDRLSPKNLKVQVRLDKNAVLMQSKNLKSSTDTLDIGSLLPPTRFEDTSGDSEIAKITSYPSSVTRRSASIKNLTPTTVTSTQRQTSTPSVTETTDRLSRQSRSVSRSLYDESKTEYSDNEDDYIEEEVKLDRSDVKSYPTLRSKLVAGLKNLFKRSSTATTKFGSSSSSSSASYQIPREFGGAIGAGLLLILIPLVSYYLQWCCEQASTCNLKIVSYSKIVTAISDYTSFLKYFTKESVSAYIIYTSVLFVVSAIPIGRNVKLPSNDRGGVINFNLLMMSVLASTALIIGETLKYNPADFILKNYLKFLTFNILSAFILSLWCYVRLRFFPTTSSNPYAKTGNFLIDFSLGREINPKWFNLIDIKLLSYRTSIINILILLEILILKNVYIPKIPILPAYNETSILKMITDCAKYYYENTNCTNYATLFSILLVLIYVCDLIIFEHHLATSFELQHEGVGALLLLRYAVTPFLLISIPKYIHEKHLKNLPIWIYLITLILFGLGLLLKRISNLIKYRYRMDPYNKELVLMESLPTFQGKRLLLGKLWGKIRQPNYAGDIISLISLTLPLYGKFAWPPFISITLLIIYLLHRAYRVNSRNYQRYSSAWQRYCTKVRYMIIPKIY